jgi:Holliday junction resolvase RusA-like endonuclease
MYALLLIAWLPDQVTHSTDPKWIAQQSVLTICKTRKQQHNIATTTTTTMSTKSNSATTPAGTYAAGYYLSAFEDESTDEESDDDGDVVYLGTKSPTKKVATTATTTTVKEFSCILDGPPVPQMRPRVAKKGGVWYSSKTTSTKKKIQEEFRAAAGPGGVVFPKNVPCKMTATFYLPRPKHHFGKAARKEPKFIKQQYLGDGILSVTRTDIDNLAKMILDAGNKIIYHDDAQVVQLLATKLWHTTGNCTGFTMVRVEEIHWSGVPADSA